MKHLVRLIVCTSGKLGFLDEDHAKGAVIRAEVRGVELRVYKCPECKRWHTSRVKTGQEMVRKALREMEYYARKS